MPTETDRDEDASSTGTFRPAATPSAELAALDRGMRQHRARATFIYKKFVAPDAEAVEMMLPKMSQSVDMAAPTDFGPGAVLHVAAHGLPALHWVGNTLKDTVEVVVLGSNDEQMYATVRTESLADKHFDMDLSVSLSGLDEYEATTMKRLLTANLRTFLTCARQENAEHRIKQLLQAIAPEDPLAEVELKVAEATVDLRREFLERVPVLTSAEVHKNAGFPGGNASQTVLRWRKAGKIFGVSHGGRDLYPAFQFGPDGRPLPLIAEVLEILRRADGASDWDTALWFAGDSGWFAGKAPIDALQSDPEAVKQAAEQEVLRDEY